MQNTGADTGATTRAQDWADTGRGIHHTHTHTHEAISSSTHIHAHTHLNERIVERYLVGFVRLGEMGNILLQLAK